MAQTFSAFRRVCGGLETAWECSAPFAMQYTRRFDRGIVLTSNIKRMKKLLLLALLPLLFTSCSSDDDDSSNVKNDLIGVWQETFYWDRTDWHTWGFVSSPVWEFKNDMTYRYFDSVSKYQSNEPTSNGTWSISDNYLTTGNHARKYSFSEDKQTFTWENVAIMKKRNDI